MPAGFAICNPAGIHFYLAGCIQIYFLSFLQFSDGVFCRRRFQGNQEGGYLSVLIYHLSLNST